MKVKEIIDLVVHGDEAASSEVGQLFDEILAGIKTVTWPKGAADFSIRPERKANGVKPVKDACIAHLAQCGWEKEKRLAIGEEHHPGPIDAARKLESGRWFAFEWETGNISSSHRAINKMLLGLKRGLLGAAVLVVPTRDLYKYLTDRVGNLDELRAYFEIWRAANVPGRLTIIAIEHDREDKAVRRIPKGTDGRSLQRRWKR
jgi:hypothetical protein